jgi:hypothetical protein
LAEDYARKLALLSGDPFETEVITALQQTISSFQRVPDKPHGDGGLDGLSHQYSRAYCCYGLELQPGPGTLAAALRKKIANKFKADLRRLLAVEFRSRKLVEKANIVLAGVLGDPPSSRIMMIILITNVFEDNRLIGDLRKGFEEYMNASKKRFVDGRCELVIWGPIDFANNMAVSEQCLLRVENPGLFEVLKTVEQQAKTHEPSDQDKFNEKFAYLDANLPRLKEGIQALKTTFKLGWSKSILIDQQLAATLPNVHEEYERARKTAATNAHIASGKQGVDPFELLENVRVGLRIRMAELVNGGLPPSTRDELVEAETGRLIGECPLDWRSQS